MQPRQQPSSRADGHAPKAWNNSSGEFDTTLHYFVPFTAATIFWLIDESNERKLVFW